MSAPGGCPRNVYKMMVDCWNPNKDNRPTFKEILTRLQNRNQMITKGKNNSKLGEATRTKNVFPDLQEVYSNPNQAYFDI